MSGQREDTRMTPLQIICGVLGWDAATMDDAKRVFPSLSMAKQDAVCSALMDARKAFSNDAFTEAAWFFKARVSYIKTTAVANG